MGFSQPAAAIITSVPEAELSGPLAAGIDRNDQPSPWSGVGSVLVEGPSRHGIYSGVLIDRRHVLTAAHVVSGMQPGHIGFMLNHRRASSQRLGAVAVVIHPDYSGFNSRRPNDDLALIRLAADVPADVPVYPLYRQLIASGELLTLVGYGGGGDGITGQNIAEDPTVRRVGYNRADAFGLDDEGSGRVEVYQFDFDGPDPGTNRMGGYTLGSNLESSVGGGDSGSAAFVHDGTGWQLAGINTLQWSNADGRQGVFGGGGGGVLLSAYASWIDATVHGPRRQGFFGWMGALLLAVASGAGLKALHRRRRTKSG